MAITVQDLVIIPKSKSSAYSNDCFGAKKMFQFLFIEGVDYN